MNGIDFEVSGDMIKAKLKMPSTAQDMRRRLDVVCRKALQAGATNIEVELDMGSAHENKCYSFHISNNQGTPHIVKHPPG